MIWWRELCCQRQIAVLCLHNDSLMHQLIYEQQRFRGNFKEAFLLIYHSHRTLNGLIRERFSASNRQEGIFLLEIPE